MVTNLVEFGVKNYNYPLIQLSSKWKQSLQLGAFPESFIFNYYHFSQFLLDFPLDFAIVLVLLLWMHLI